MSTQNCTEVTLACPVSATTYGYIPNLGANTLFLVIFAICCLSQIGFGIYFRAWSFMVALVIGTLMEAVGYIGRLIMHGNVWRSAGFQTQVVCLILAPSLLAAGVYLSLKHIILYLGPQDSRLPPKWYTWIFIGFDILSILMQAMGGGIAAGAKKTNKNSASTGNNIMIAGIALQVVTMVICGFLAVDFAIRHRRSSKKDTSTARYLDISRTKAYAFFAAEVFAYITILIRCIYRLPEMAGGWGNSLMRDETEFLVLDGMMVALACLTFTVLHPGFWFPPMTGRVRVHSEKSQDEEELR